MYPEAIVKPPGSEHTDDAAAGCVCPTGKPPAGEEDKQDIIAENCTAAIGELGVTVESSSLETCCGQGEAKKPIGNGSSTGILL